MMNVSSIVRLFLSKKDEKSSNPPSNHEIVHELDPYNEPLSVVIEHNISPNNCDSGDIHVANVSVGFKSNQNHTTLTTSSIDKHLPSSSAVAVYSNTQPSPPLPPLRSPFTKLSSNPLNDAFQSFNNMGSSLNPFSPESVSDINPTQKAKLHKIKQELNLSKSDHSITAFFDSKLQMLDDLENEGSTSEHSVDLKSLTTTTDTSIHTTTTATTNSSTTQKSSHDNLVVTLKKSLNGFGFSLTSRQNPVDLTNPVYVSKVLDNGPALLDGRMKAGDRIMMINDTDVRNLSQKEIKDILLNILVDSTVNIGLYRPNSDAISTIIGSSNTSIIQKKNAALSLSNRTGDDTNNDNNPMPVEEQTPEKFTLCDCAYNHALVDSEFDMYHFVISPKTVKLDYLSPLFVDLPNYDTLTKSTEVKSEPPAIQLHHQNKLSPSSFSTKQIISTKYSQATLGISIRKKNSQIFFDDYESICYSRSVAGSSSVKINQDDNQTKLSHKICPNCHGLLPLKEGVFVTAINPGDAAYMDGRLAIGDEIIAVQGVSLCDGDSYVFPDNKVPLGDPYESSKVSQMASQFHNRMSTIDTKKTDPKNLLKQLLNHAQSTSNSVSLVILRRNLEKGSLSTYMRVTDANYGHNVTVAADVHTQYSKDLIKGELFNSVVPNLINSKTPLPIPYFERFEDLNIKDNRRRFYGKDGDNSPEHNMSTDLIYLHSEHDSDNECAVNPNSKIPNDKVHLAELGQISSGILAKFENECVHFVKKNDKKVELVSVNSVYSVENLNHTFISSPSSYQAPNSTDTLQPSYFSREDNTRQSFSLKRIHLNSPSSSRISRLSIFKADEMSNRSKLDSSKPCDFRRPKSEVILSRVEEESSSSDIGEPADIENHIKALGGRVTLRRRAAITRNQSRKSLT